MIKRKKNVQSIRNIFEDKGRKWIKKGERMYKTQKIRRLIALYEAGNKEECETLFKQAIKQAKKEKRTDHDFEFRIAYSFCLITDEQYGSVIACLDALKPLSLEEESMLSLYHFLLLGTCHARLKNYGWGEFFLKKAVDVGKRQGLLHLSSFRDAWCNLELTYDALSMHEKATLLFNQYYSQHSNETSLPKESFYYRTVRGYTVSSYIAKESPKQESSFSMAFNAQKEGFKLSETEELEKSA